MEISYFYGPGPPGENIKRSIPCVTLFPLITKIQKQWQSWHLNDVYKGFIIQELKPTDFNLIL